MKTVSSMNGRFTLVGKDSCKYTQQDIIEALTYWERNDPEWYIMGVSQEAKLLHRMLK